MDLANHMYLKQWFIPTCRHGSQGCQEMHARRELPRQNLCQLKLLRSQSKILFPAPSLSKRGAPFCPKWWERGGGAHQFFMSCAAPSVTFCKTILFSGLGFRLVRATIEVASRRGCGLVGGTSLISTDRESTLSWERQDIFLISLDTWLVGYCDPLLKSRTVV